MDNDPSNDLRGPNGEHYNDPIQFADSCMLFKYVLSCVKQFC